MRTRFKSRRGPALVVLPETFVIEVRFRKNRSRKFLCDAPKGSRIRLVYKKVEACKFTNSRDAMLFLQSQPVLSAHTFVAQLTPRKA